MTEVQTIEQIYSEILKGKRQLFPRGTWNPANGGFDNFKRCFRWLINHELGYSRDKIVEEYELRFLFKYKLQGAYSRMLRGKSTYEIINTCFPEHEFKPWEFNATEGYWDEDDNVREALHWFLHEHLNYKYEDLVFLKSEELYNTKFHRILCDRFDKKLGNLLEFLYPGEDWSMKIRERQTQNMREIMTQQAKTRERDEQGRFSSQSKDDTYGEQLKEITEKTGSRTFATILMNSTYGLPKGDK